VLSVIWTLVAAAVESVADPTCLKELGEEGWRCLDGECVSLEWLCDGFNQCGDDTDEGSEPGQGCNLFPDSQCRSFGGLQYHYCERTGDCYLDPADAASCNTTQLPVNSGCESDEEWKCKDGRCIKKIKVCDRVEHCKDASDEGADACYPLIDQEGSAEKPGLHCDQPDCEPLRETCQSFRGERYARCGSTQICTPADLAQSVQENGNQSLCRQCDEQYQWRCNDGWCISSNLTNNGLPDCRDGSDERSLPYSWWVVLLATTTVVLSGLLLSFACRRMGYKNCRNCFYCTACESQRSKEYVSIQLQPTAPPPPGPRGDDEVDARVTPINNFSQGEEGDTEEDSEDEEVDGEDLVVSHDLPLELLKMIEDKEEFWELKIRDDVMTKILGSRITATTVKCQYIHELKQLYTYAHTDPLHLHHLYSFIMNRCATVKERAKITNIFFDFEQEIHSMSKIEVLKCWRLMIGASDTLVKTVESVSDEPGLCSRLYTSFLPFRNCMRQFRRKIFSTKPKKDSSTFRYFKTAYFTLAPFVGASFLYFETIKNIVYVNIVYNALYDLTDGYMSDYPFEMFLLVYMIGAIVTVQLLFVTYSVAYSDQIFEVSHADDCNRTFSRIFFKIIAGLLSPLIPCYVLANKVYYDARLDIQQRHLQSFPAVLDIEDLGATVPQENESKVLEMKKALKEKQFQQKMEIYRVIRKLEAKSLQFRKIYSYYRVTSGVIESVSITVVLVLLMFVTGRRGREINLIVGVEHRLRTFFGLVNYQGVGFLAELNLVRDFVIGFSLVYSFGMVTSALVRYWYQGKNLSLSMGGRVILFAYMSAMTFNRLTIYISIFSVTQPLLFDNGTQDPSIGLPSAMVIYTVFLLGHLVAVYFLKQKISFDWQDGKCLDHWINVLVNSVAIIPFMVQVDPLKILKEAEKKFLYSPEKKANKRDSLKRKKSLLKLSSMVENLREEDNNRSFADMLLPDLNRFAAPLLYDDLRREIKDQWWANPRQNLDADMVFKNIRDLGLRIKLESLNRPEFVKENIMLTLKQLEASGIVNVPLLNPAPTKKEYFWLSLILLAENIVALTIEIACGGVWTSQGHYYSWDIRLVSLLLSLLFLLMYYKKYHILRDLTSNPLCGTWLHYLPICCCCSIEKPMRAAPNEEAMDRVLNTYRDTAVHKETQTDPGSVRGVTVVTQTDFGSSPVIQQQPYPVQTSVQIIGGNGQASVQTLPPHGQLAAVQAEVHVGMTCPTCNHTRT